MAEYVVPPPQLVPLGDAAVVLEFGGAISPATLARIRAVQRHLTQQPFAGLRELVPAYTTLTVYYDPWLVSQASARPPHEQVVAWLQARLAAAEAPAEAPAGAEVVALPVCYGGEWGPDLAVVAQHTGLTPAEVVTRHAAPTYLVHLLGFLPGFAYLGGLEAGLATPRRAAPRPLVPAGAVGIAGAQTGVYPLASPGGWQLIGRTPLRLFNPAWPVPTRLQAGQHVRFVPISEAEFEQLRRHEH